MTEACLSAAEKSAPLNAFTTLTADLARRQAEVAAARLAVGGAPDLCGIPLGIKDLFCVEGVRSQAGSNILEDFAPPYESSVTRRLWDAGAVCIGKLNMDEFAMGSSNETSCYGPAVSPWRRAGDNRGLTPGGSSGGSAAAVAGGSGAGRHRHRHRRLDPPAGRLHRHRRGEADIRALLALGDRRLRLLAGPGRADGEVGARRGDHAARDGRVMIRRIPTSADLPVPDFEAALTGDIRGKRIGIPKEYRVEGMPAEIEALWARGAEMLRDAGAETVDISLPHTKYALPAYYVIAPAEASSNLARYDGVRYGRRARIGAGDGITRLYERTRAEGFGAEVKRRVMIGTYVLSAGYYDAYYLRAQKVRSLIKRDFERVFAEGIDAILTPATPSASFALGEMADADPVQMYLNDVFTVTVNLAGLPGASVPGGVDSAGLPLGLQVIGRPWEEAEMLNIAFAIEAAAGFAAKPEKWW